MNSKHTKDIQRKTYNIFLFKYFIEFKQQQQLKGDEMFVHFTFWVLKYFLQVPLSIDHLKANYKKSTNSINQFQ